MEAPSLEISWEVDAISLEKHAAKERKTKYIEFRFGVDSIIADITQEKSIAPICYRRSAEEGRHLNLHLINIFV